MPPPPWVVDDCVAALHNWMAAVGYPLHNLTMHLKMHREGALRVILGRS